MIMQNLLLTWNYASYFIVDYHKTIISAIAIAVTHHYIDNVNLNFQNYYLRPKHHMSCTYSSGNLPVLNCYKWIHMVLNGIIIP